MKNLFTFIPMVLIPISLFSQNEVCFELEENPNPNHSAFGIFSKYVNVLGIIHIYAESNISDEKVLHVAAVAAELLDNDEVVKHRPILTALSSNQRRRKGNPIHTISTGLPGE